jgi:hypothetical protein
VDREAGNETARGRASLSRRARKICRRLAGLIRADKLAECERVYAHRTRADVFFWNIRFNWRCIPPPLDLRS